MMGASDKNVINNNARDGCSGVAGVDNEDKNSRNGSNGDDDNNNTNAEMIIDREKGLHLLVHKKWLKDSDVWWDIFACCSIGFVPRFGPDCSVIVCAGSCQCCALL